MAKIVILRKGLSIITAVLITFVAAAGVVAQEGDTVVSLTGVDSENFPEVTLFLAVMDAEGGVENLTPADFQVIEEGVAESVEVTNTESARLDGVRLAVALDLSVPGSDLAKMKEAAKDLINSSGPEDKLAIITFDDTVNVAYDFTNNKTELLTTVDNLTPRGDSTTLHAAIARATDELTQLAADDTIPKGLPGIVVIADSQDNTGTVAAGAAIGGVQQAQLPLYVVGFGEKVQPDDPLKAQVNATRGRYITLSASDQLLSTVQEIEGQLRQGYQVSFLSEQPLADNAMHGVTVLVGHPSGSGEAVGQFRAVSGEVAVTLVGVGSNQKISGLARLNPEVDTNESVASYAVTYLLDDQELRQIDAPPYTFEWDTTTATPGEHRLSVVVKDSVGNVGRDDVNVIIAVPVTVELSPVKDEVTSGEQVGLVTTIDPAEDVAQVELLLNDVVVSSSDTAPFGVSLDKALYQEPGRYDITLRVKDESGQIIGERSAVFLVLPAPPPQPSLFQRIITNRTFINGVTVVAALIASLAFLLIGLILLRLISAAQRLRSYRRCRVEVVNQGNIRSRYTVRAQDIGDRLKFKFSLNGIDLAPQLIPQPAGGQAYPAVESGPAGSATPVGYQGPSRESQAGPAAPVRASAPAQSQSGVRQSYEKAKATEAQAQGCLYIIVDMLDAIASVLPGSLGSPLRRLSQTIYGGQRSVERAKMAPSQVATTANYVKGEVGNVSAGSRSGSSFGSSGSTPAQGVASDPSAGAVFYQGDVQLPAQPQNKATRSRTRTSPNVVPSGWSETPLIEPGARLLLDLLIMPDQPFKKKNYGFTIDSKSLEESTAVSFEEPGQVQVRGIFWLWRYLPRVLVVLFVLGLIAIVTLLALWRVTGVNVLDYL